MTVMTSYLFEDASTRGYRMPGIPGGSGTLSVSLGRNVIGSRKCTAFPTSYIDHPMVGFSTRLPGSVDPGKQWESEYRRLIKI